MPAKKSIIPTTVNPDLQKERNNASFKTEDFSAWWYGGAEKLRFKREMENHILKDYKGDNISFFYKSHDEMYNTTVANCVAAAKKLKQLQAELNPGGTDIWPSLFGSSFLWGVLPGGNPFGVQSSMVANAIKTHGTDEQYEKFGKRFANFEICGTYAQTELGHGTFLRGLETRADYDKATGEFILNSPTLTSYKWWPGGLGHSSNYTILVAQLYIDNKSKGLQMFVVPLRDEETHLPLPGIDIGDIGKKIGFLAVNNGYLGLRNVRIPRTNMLMRNSKVLPDGTFVQSPASILTYYTMVYMRCLTAHIATNTLAIAVTIATRYSCVRRQSPINANEPEPKIIDHVTQQLKLFSEIANVVAYRVASTSLTRIYEQTTDEITRGDYKRLSELHAVSCALKAISSYDSTSGIERLRQACGGHGYMTASNLGNLYSGASAACTYEGENTVLLLQTGRYLLKTWRAVIASNAKLEPTVAYLGEIVKKSMFGQWTGTWENIISALQFATANKVRLAYENMSARLKAGQSEAEAANNTGIELTNAAELHGRLFVCTSLLEEVKGRNANQRPDALNKVLLNLLELYLVSTALRHMADILRFVNLTDADLRSLQLRLEESLKKVRPDAVSICDAFAFHDHVLCSALGSYDGNVYERLFESAKNSPLNAQPVPRSFHEVLKPFMKSNM